jgi:branched-chain amino acid transport system permease protein
VNLTILAVVTGLAIGSVYGLIAIGYATVFSATRVFNLAQGDLVMVGVMVFWLTLEDWHWARWEAALAVLVFVPALSVVIERVAVRPIRHRTDGIGWFITTLAASIIIETVATNLYGNQPIHSIPDNINGSLRLGSISIQYDLLAAIVVLVACLFLVEAFYRRTWLGMSMRAIANDQQLAMLRGLNPNRLGMIAFAIGGLLAAIAALIIAPLVGSDVSIGLNYSVAGFVAIAIGGFGSLRGAVVGAWLLGIAEELFGRFYNSQFQVVAGLGLLVVILAVRPTGIFGTPGARQV